MKNRQIFRLLMFVSFLLILENSYAQEVVSKLIKVAEVPATPVKDQAMTGTCWSFGTTSFIESELIRTGKGEYNLSEMFTVRCTYSDHANQFVRYHGKLNFTSGAEGWDMFNVINNYGIVPQTAYPGLKVDSIHHNHSEMDRVLKSMVNVLVEQGKVSTVWEDGFNGLLDSYLGKYPKNFEYNGKVYTPETFRDFLGVEASNYCAITSFNHHPYYSEFVFESPDNWSNGIVKNVMLDDLTATIDHALKNGYSVIWASDVSDPGFNYEKGFAIVPEENWDSMSKEEKTEIFRVLVVQRDITPETRQEAYNDYSTTDDHLMHIVGLYKDKKGNKYYKVKNSWGKNSNDLGGYFYASEAYIKYKTMTIALHKDAIPSKVTDKF